jgi:peptide/nickel transport system substrate-binding protein
MPPLVSRRAILSGATALAGAVALGDPLGPRLARAARDRVVVRTERDIQNLDPAFRIGAIEGNVMRAVYQRLTSFRAGSLEYAPDAAERIRQVNDKLIEFGLKPGLRFTGGYGEVTADDVKFSFERFQSATKDGKKSSYASDWGALEGVEVTGKLTGRIHLKRPAPSLWRITLCDGSGSIVSRKAFEALGDKVATQPVGSGAYLIQEWVPNQQLVLRANPDYAGSRPAFREVVVKPVAELKTAEIAFRAGELDFTQIDVASVDTFEKLPDARIVKMPGFEYIWVGMNVERPPLDNPKIRQAVRAAIDVDQVVLAAYQGKVARANAMIQPSLLGYWKEAPAYKKDAALARRLLGEGGQPGGFKTRLTLLNTSLYKTMGQVIQANLAEVGVQCELDVRDSGTFWSAGKGDGGKQLELSLQRFSAKMDPTFTSQWFVSEQIGVWNWQRWANPEFDRLHTLADSTNDVAERTKAVVRMQQLMDESAAFVWLTHGASIFAAKKWLQPAILPNGTDWQHEFFREA